jgi:hypothetical protein
MPDRFPVTIELCETCVYFLEYGTTGDASAGEPSPAQAEADDAHARLMCHALDIRDLSHVFHGCGAECPDHGVSAYDGNEEAYREARDVRDTETWFSNSICDGCGALPGQREHGTLYVR